jgi:pilus assembly protein CpaC
MFSWEESVNCNGFPEDFSAMTPVTRVRSGLGSSTAKRLAAAALLAFAGWAGISGAEPPPCRPDCNPPQAPPLPSVPQRPPRPATGDEAVSKFVDHVSVNDAAFEVYVGQGRILTLKESLEAKGKQEPVIAIGDPKLLDFLPINAKQIRLVGKVQGVTDLSITTVDGRTYSFEVRVVTDLDPLRAKLSCLFPDASVKLTQLREHIIVEGQARDTAQIHNIIETVNEYLRSVQTTVSGLKALESAQPTRPAGQLGPVPAPIPVPADSFGVQATVPIPRVINLLRVPGSQQVLLKVRVAELDRTGLRQIGGDFLSIDPDTGAIIGTQIGGAGVTATAIASGRIPLTGSSSSSLTPNTTAFGIFQEGDFAIFLSALRRNTLLKLLAEPNLVTMNGQAASFLAGGEFPVPVAQSSSGGAAPTVTVEFKEFGVRLAFLPYILDDESIRLTVDPEVSTIDTTLGTVLVPGGTPVPGLNTRKAHTVVELHQGQTLAIAGLMQLSLAGSTSRIPVMGDLPIIGPFFSNTSSNRQEKELIVLVTPYLVEPMHPNQVPPSPGDEVNEPNDLELYLMNRMESRRGKDWRSTTEYDDPLHVVRGYLKLEKDHVRGPFGFCE